MEDLDSGAVVPVAPGVRFAEIYARRGAVGGMPNGAK
jgi:hypothetical protein